MKDIKRPRPNIRRLARLTFACVSSLLISAVSANDKQDSAADTGTIEGVVTFSGEVPRSKLRDNAGQQKKLLSVDNKSRGLRYALIYLEPTDGRDAKPIVPNKGEPSQVIIDQVEHEFSPHLIAIRDGERVKFTNSDAANHNVRAISLESKNQFNIFTGAGGDYSHQFVAEKKLRPIVLSCDIHPWMRAWVYVFRHPYFAVSDKHGIFKILNVPTGNHEVTILQPDVSYRKTVSVKVEVRKANKITLKISSDNLEKS